MTSMEEENQSMKVEIQKLKNKCKILEELNHETEISVCNYVVEKRREKQKSSQISHD